MKSAKKKHLNTVITTLLSFTFLFFSLPRNAAAHCDTLNGPVINAAKVALEKQDVTPLLKWVQPEDEQEIQDAFQKTLTIRIKGADSKALADMYFFETLVRIHRAGEGAPYTGIQPSGMIDPAVALADKALERGNADKLVGVLTTAMEKGIHDRFQDVRNKQSRKEESVQDGREFVEAYVDFTHYVEGLHSTINGNVAHHRAESK